MHLASDRLPVRTPFFYGWLILGVTMASAFVAAASGQLFMGIMLKPLTDDLGWSRTTTAGAITAGTIASGLLSPAAGYVVDRWGPRGIMSAAGVGATLALLLMAGMGSLWQFYLGYVVARSLGQACLGSVVPMATVANWFVAKRGRALGLITMALPLGGSVLAFLAQLVIEHGSWRNVFLGLAALTALTAIVPPALLLRQSPEQVGLHPDGAATATSSAAPRGRGRGVPAGARDPEHSYTLGQAMRTRSLWLLIVLQMITITGSGALSFQQVAYYTDHGISATAAAFSISAYALCGAFSNGLWGYLSERVSERVLAFGVMLLAAAGAWLMGGVRTEAMAIAISGLLGLAARGQGSPLTMIFARYYGRRYFGSITGFVQPFTMIGLGLGPLLGSLAFDLTHAYDTTFLAATVLYLIGAAMIPLAGPPKPLTTAEAVVPAGKAAAG